MSGHGQGPSAPHHRPHHVADPAALEDPVHHDVAEHELHEEAESDADEDTEGEADGGEAEDAAGPGAAPGPAPGPGPDRAVWHGQWGQADAAAFDLPIDPTGDARVDAALSRLSGLGGLPTTDHPGLYEDVHRRLQDTLDELDSGAT